MTLRTGVLIFLLNSYANRSAAGLLYWFRFTLLLGVVFALVAGSGFNLAWRLVFGEIKFLLNLGLTFGKLVVTLVMLEGCVDFAFKLLRPLLRIADVAFQSGVTFLKSLHDGFQRANCAKRAVSVTRARCN